MNSEAMFVIYISRLLSSHKASCYFYETSDNKFIIFVTHTCISTLTRRRESNSIEVKYNAFLLNQTDSLLTVNC